MFFADFELATVLCGTLWNFAELIVRISGTGFNSSLFIPSLESLSLPSSGLIDHSWCDSIVKLGRLIAQC